MEHDNEVYLFESRKYLNLILQLSRLVNSHPLLMSHPIDTLGTSFGLSSIRKKKKGKQLWHDTAGIEVQLTCLFTWSCCLDINFTIKSAKFLLVFLNFSFTTLIVQPHQSRRLPTEFPARFSYYQTSAETWCQLTDICWFSTAWTLSWAIQAESHLLYTLMISWQEPQESGQHADDQKKTIAVCLTALHPSNPSQNMEFLKRPNNILTTTFSFFDLSW